MRFPAASYHWPTAREMADYLEAYAARFDLPVVSGVRVDPSDGRTMARTASSSRPAIARWQAAQVIVATGPSARLSIPSSRRELDPSIRQLHSSDYHRASDVADGPAPVVGLSHSGADIAFEARGNASDDARRPFTW